MTSYSSRGGQSRDYTPGQDKDERVAPLASTRRPADAVHVVGGLAGGVILHDPVDLGQVQTACRHIGTKLLINTTEQGVRKSEGQRVSE
jgi:hypothetical protein